MKKSLLILIICFSTSAVINAQEIGLQLYSVRNQTKTDLEGTLKKIRAMGIRELEGIDLYGKSVSDYKKLLDKLDFKFVGFGVDYGDLSKDLTQVIYNAKTLGATYVICYWIPHEGNEFNIKNVVDAAVVFNKAGKIFKENGLEFCYHPHGFEFRPSKNGTLFDDLISKTIPAYVNYELDVYWAKQGGVDPVELIKKYPKRFSLLHLKDRLEGTVSNDKGSADEETNVILGKGDVNIKDIMSAAKSSAVKHYFIEDESSRVISQLPPSLTFLKSLKN